MVMSFLRRRHPSQVMYEVKDNLSLTVMDSLTFLMLCQMKIKALSFRGALLPFQSGCLQVKISGEMKAIE
jgi:hypothetical protein